jgi:hypothetical protein
MPEAQNSANQKALQHQALPMEAPGGLFSDELATSAAFAGDTWQDADNTTSKAVSQPTNIQRQLAFGKLHSTQAQKLVMRAGSLYGNKATQQLVQRSLANKSRPQAQREASQTVQRDLLGGITNFINTGNLTTSPSIPSLSTPNTNLGVPNVTNLDKPPVNKDFSNLPPGNPIHLGSIAPPTVPDNNQGVPNVTNLGDNIPNPDKPPANKDFTARVPVEQLPPLPPGADGVIVAPGTVNTAQFGTVVDAKGNPIGLIILAEVLNGNPRGTLLSLDGTQVIQPGTPNTPGNGNGNGTGGNVPPVSAPTEVGGGANVPVRIQGYDPGTVLQQLPEGGSIGFLNQNENPNIPGAARSSVGVVENATGKRIAWVILDGPNAGDLYGYKNSQKRIGSVRPGAPDNPFKPVAVPVSPQNPATSTTNPVGTNPQVPATSGGSGGGIIKIAGFVIDTSQIVPMNAVAGSPGAAGDVTREAPFQGCRGLVDGSRDTWIEAEQEVQQSGINKDAVLKFIQDNAAGFVALLAGGGWAGMDWLKNVGDYMKANSGVNLLQRINPSEMPAVLRDLWSAIRDTTAINPRTPNTGAGSGAVAAHISAAIATGTVSGINADMVIKVWFARQAENNYNKMREVCNKAYPGYF